MSSQVSLIYTAPIHNKSYYPIGAGYLGPYSLKHQTCIVVVRTGIRSASAPPHEAGSQTYSSPHVNSDDSQQTIYNLQPARNVFYKKGSPTQSFAYSFGPNCGSGRVCRH